LSGSTFETALVTRQGLAVEADRRKGKNRIHAP